MHSFQGREQSSFEEKLDFRLLFHAGTRALFYDKQVLHSHRQIKKPAFTLKQNSWPPRQSFNGQPQYGHSAKRTIKRRPLFVPELCRRAQLKKSNCLSAEGTSCGFFSSILAWETELPERKGSEASSERAAMTHGGWPRAECPGRRGAGRRQISGGGGGA